MGFILSPVLFRHISAEVGLSQVDVVPSSVCDHCPVVDGSPISLSVSATCTLSSPPAESQKEVYFLFPDTVVFGRSTSDSFPAGKLRFNGKRDLVSITADLRLDDHFNGRIGFRHLYFVDNWYKMVHKLAFRSAMLEALTGGLSSNAAGLV